MVTVIPGTACLPHRLNSTFFEIFSNGVSPNRGQWSDEKISKISLILAFEVIMQPPKHTFEIALFSKFRVLYTGYFLLGYIVNVELILA